MNNLKTLLWWMYEPNDEREQQLYFLAYQRCSKIFLGFLLFVLTSYLLSTLGVDAYTFPSEVYAVFALGCLLFSLFAASMIFRHEELSFKNRKNYYWQTIRNGFIFIGFALLFNNLLLNQIFGVLDHIPQIDRLGTIMQTVTGVLSIATIAIVFIGGIYVIIQKRKQK